MNTNDYNFYLNGVVKKNRRIIAKTITLIESSLPEHRQIADKVIEKLLQNTGKSVRLGITGVPGVGKSTFIESLGLNLAQKGHKVAVLAVDPSSKRSGGSILGDKTRMEQLSCHDNAFIRPSPSGDTLGGVASKTREIMLVCEAAGYDVILVETMGVGQSETMVATMVDFFLVLMISGAGDELQGIKKGVLEIADALAINKADGDNIQRAENARQEFDIAMHMISPKSPTWRPPVLTCSSIIENGTKKVWETVLKHKSKMQETGEFEQKRKTQAVDWMTNIINQELKTRFWGNADIAGKISELVKNVTNEQISPSKAAKELLAIC